MTPLTDLERIVLSAILADVRQHRACPTRERVAHLTGRRQVGATLRSLVKKGYVEQPYKGAPWVPLRDTGGEEVEVRLGEIAPLRGMASYDPEDLIRPTWPGAGL